jgi:hypothetical protein
MDARDEKAWMHATRRDVYNKEAGMHTMRGMDACDEEQMHSASMNEYYAESRG